MSPEGFNTKNARVEEGKRARTYVHVPFYVPNEDKVTRTGVADVGVNGDRAPRVSLDEVGRFSDGRITGDRAVNEGSGMGEVADETGSGGR